MPLLPRAAFAAHPRNSFKTQQHHLPRLTAVNPTVPCKVFEVKGIFSWYKYYVIGDDMLSKKEKETYFIMP